MDFGNPKELRFLKDLRPIPGSEAFGRRGGGGACRYRLCDTRNEAKVPSYKIRQKMRINTFGQQEI